MRAQVMDGDRRGGSVFALVWSGQAVSLVGSGLTTFALGLWVLVTRQSITDYAAIALCGVLPRLALGPVAGAVVDRHDRRLVMLAADGVGLALSGCLAILVLTGQLQLWHIYAAAAISGAAGTFHWPAWSAATTLLIPQRHLGRAAGLATLAQAASDVAAPLIAAALFVSVGIAPILAADVCSFAVALVTLSIVRFPQPQPSPLPSSWAGRAGPERGARHRLRDELSTGLRYLGSRPDLLVLVAVVASVDFLWGLIGVLVAPLVLAFADPQSLGLVFAVAGAGMVAGSLVMTAWGGPRRLLVGLLGGEALSGIAFVAIGLRPEVTLVAAGVFTAHFAIPIIFGCNQAIWQVQVPADLQGRVFAARQMIERLATPLAFIVAGPMAERVFDPLLVGGGPLAGSLGGLLGTGPGRGIGLIFATAGLLQIVILSLVAIRMRRSFAAHERTRGGHRLPAHGL